MNPFEVIELSDDEITILPNQELERIENQLLKIDSQIDQLYEQKEYLTKEKEKIINQIQLSEERPYYNKDQTYYEDRKFEWHGLLIKNLKKYWKVDNFRFNQLPIVNAALSYRDIFVIMPTGGGKSLCYQLPTTLEDDKITIVISPLISLIKDQLMDLKNMGIGAAGLFGNPSKEYRKAVITCLTSKHGGSEKEWADLGIDSELKLIYVTPEQIARSKRFLSSLEKAYLLDRLARFVIDECHCCSQLGHDFRPDYKKLSILKIAFPKIPIIALTATCSSSVMTSVMEILGLEPTTTRRSGCLVFTSPLYRPNLSYSVAVKPSSGEGVITSIVEYILDKHMCETGIVYCLSRKDTEVVAEAISSASNHVISARAYHSDMTEDEKHNIHTQWRSGDIKVVVATVAFGLGINHPDVRFVIHHSLSKSLDGYYQESGRAGRDGKPSDCVLFYRAADIFRLSGMVVSDPGGLKHLYEMVSYVFEFSTCRKLIIEDYFSGGNPNQNNQTCGNCDICCFPDSLPKPRDCGDVAFAILSVLSCLAKDKNNRYTSTMLISALKATARSKLSAQLSGLKLSGSVTLPISKDFSKEDCEYIIVKLLLMGYIKEDFHFTAYNTISYLMITNLGLREIRKGKSFNLSIQIPNQTISIEIENNEQISKRPKFSRYID